MKLKQNIQIQISGIAIVLFVLLMTHCTIKQSESEPLAKTYFNYDDTVKQISNKPQKEINSDYNKTDSNGKKQGLWIDEQYSPYRRELYYKNGILSGVCKEFYANGNLAVFGEYTNGVESGKWYYFHYDYGHLWMTYENFAKNYDTITYNSGGKKYVPDYKCYFKWYYSNGNIKEEGWLLWYEGEGLGSDFSVEYGTWKYYNEQGKLIKMEEYKSHVHERGNVP